MPLPRVTLFAPPSTYITVNQKFLLLPTPGPIYIASQMRKEKLCLVYITTKNKNEAKKIGHALVSARLAACVNILDGMHSMYWWQGKIQDDFEAILIAKTKKSLFKKLIQKVKSLHSYECPCVVALPLLDGNPNFLKWITHETI